MTIGIIGLGLMGGSLSMSIRDIYEDVTVLGLDHNEKHCIEALEYGLVDRIVEKVDDFFSVDVLFLAVPVDGIISILPLLKDIVNTDMTIIDLGSTKEKIVNCVPSVIRKNFIPAHPMTGTEKFGPSAAIPDLYKGKAIVLCNLADSGKLQKDLAKQLFSNIGMKIFYMDAQEHDRHAAYISHMPHALSYALANSVMDQEKAKAIVALAGGGFRDMSRIAKSSPNMWEDIFRQNKTNLLEAITSFTHELNKCKTLIEDEEWTKLHEWMGEANELHDIL